MTLVFKVDPTPAAEYARAMDELFAAIKFGDSPPPLRCRRYPRRPIVRRP